MLAVLQEIAQSNYVKHEKFSFIVLAKSKGLVRFVLITGLVDNFGPFEEYFLFMSLNKG